MKVLHHCDVRCCVNPAHLWLGTMKENTHDAIKKNRAPQLSHRPTHCIHGHELTQENVYLWRGARKCRECLREIQRRIRAKASRKLLSMSPDIR
jgi:hypothetical protein